MTKTEAKRLARRARKYGYFHPAGTDLYYVYCPKECGAKCEARPWAGFKAMMHLDNAVIEHLLEDCSRVVRA